jgi:hypothetical protein
VVWVYYITNVTKFAYAIVAFTSLSALGNIILAALIVFRLVWYRKYLRNALGVQHGSPYANIITICVESSALMVIASGLFPILWILQTFLTSKEASIDAENFLLDINPHIYVGDLELNDF